MLLKDYASDSQHWSEILPPVFEGLSFSEIERQIQLARKKAAISGGSVADSLNELLKGIKQLPRERRLVIAAALLESGMSQRQVNELTGVARDTLRKNNQKLE